MLNELARELNQEMVYYENLHHSGWQADRIIYHDQLGSSKEGLWDSSLWMIPPRKLIKITVINKCTFRVRIMGPHSIYVQITI